MTRASRAITLSLPSPEDTMAPEEPLPLSLSLTETELLQSITNNERNWKHLEQNEKEAALNVA